MKARIAYIGLALDDGEMDVRELAPALLAFADLVKYMNKIIGGEDEIRVTINQDSIQKGSFDLTFLLNTNVFKVATSFVGMARKNGLEDLMQVLGWGVTLISAGDHVLNVFRFIKVVANKHIVPTLRERKNEV